MTRNRSSRRDFLQTLGAGAAAAAGLTACGGGGGGGTGGNGSGGGGGGGNPPPIADPILVLVQIQGGNDWLTTLPPNAGANLSAYNANRPNLALPGAAQMDLGQGIALNKELLGFDSLHSAGKVAWIPGIGMPNPNLSHFTATDLWGQGAANPNGTGWLGRWADAVFAPGDILRGIALTSDIMLMLRGANRDFVSIPSAADYGFPAYLRSTSAVPDSNLLKTGYLAALNAGMSGASRHAAEEGKLFYDAQSTFSTLLTPRTPSVPYPGDAAYPVSGISGQLSGQLKLVAQMIASNIPCQAFTTRLGGFDTHSNQNTDYPRLMRALGGAIKAFYDDLAAITTAKGAAQDRVVIVAWSEFGRRVKENNGGTDHGTAGLAFATGKNVKGGFYGGGYPNLADLDANGNMKFTTDFRSLYGTLVDKVLGGTTSTALLGASYPALGFL
jgi:uncharacterized protein (DUF1501 family)